MSKPCKLLCALVFFLGTTTLAEATTTDTAKNWIGGGVSGFGEGATGYFGQTFTVTGKDTVLDNFTFWLADFLASPYSPDYVDFEAYVTEWSHNDNFTLRGSLRVTS